MISVVRRRPGRRGARDVRHGVAAVCAVMTVSSAVACGPAPGVGSAPPAGEMPSPVPVPADAEGPFPVSRVIDGDTVAILRDSSEVKIRMLGLDTPETEDPRTPVQCFGAEAAHHATALLAHKRVLVRPDPSQDRTDRYGRLLAYVWVDGALFNLDQIAQGFGYEYTYSPSHPYRYQREFRAAARYARAHHLGLWSPATCNGVTD